MNTREQTLKQAIQENLQAFDGGNLTVCGLALFQTLGYRVDKRSESDDSPAAFLAEFNGEGLLNLEKALVGDWDAIDLLFQLTKDEIVGGNQIQIDFGKTNRVDDTVIESYLFFAVRLNGRSLQERGSDRYSRKDLATMTREINKLFLMPVMLLFQHGQTITISVINRRLNLRDESRDVLEKVTLIKDIAIASPHRAHIEILFDLSLEQLYKAHKFSNFVELHRAWQKTLDSSELNKRFFKEVADWYFWATQRAVFPADAPKDEEGQDSISVIRMITRLIFVWFLKEKGLVPEELFNRSHIETLIHFDDPASSSYYKAILQNLFFATLNQPMNRDKPGSRKFRSEGKGSRDGHYMIHNVYRYRALMKQPDAVEQLLAEVPFLNGGLFECLDQTTDDKPPIRKHPIRIDGFSDRADNSLSVPNALFFAPEQEIDLNDIYGTKNKRYKVSGLIDILQRYKFTITENTPIEEEIALDPELLGKVFENLLASYNQETRVTARKQTGSFYTPREVVDYMVDESLMVYLANALVPEANLRVRADLETDLRILLNYGSAENPFADRPDEQLLLIVAIDQLKMLDPAVGSGAFPMGILQKLVFILSKLDPNNALWKYQQKEREIQRVREDIQRAQEISYEEAREAAIVQLEDRLREIEADFENNEMDYPRKLFLIENCIYGVDIQPIAVQIAKLRFFISLVVEQKVTEQLPNRGVLPLPNLETKFVAANTLMGIDRQMNLRSEAVMALEAELGTVRRKHFMARTPQTKQKYRLQDSTLRQEICALLQETGLESATAETLAQWNPYDQNASAPFFDPEWMFGIQSGFDVVIGNPPYVRQEQIKHLKEALKAQFECFTGTADLYVFFYERGLKLLREQGVLTYISSNKYFRAAYGQKLRQFLASRSRIHQIIDFGDAPVFTAIAYPTIVIMENVQPHEQQLRALNWEGQPVEQLEAVVQQNSFWMPQGELKAQGWQLAGDESLRLLERLRKAGTPLGDYVNGRFYYGIKTGFNEAFVVDRETRDRLIAEHPSSEEVLKPFLRGRDVKRWNISFDEWYLIKIESSENKKHPWSDKPIAQAERIFTEIYPAVHRWLFQFRKQLIKRTDKGKFFWELRSCAYWKAFESSKIVYPDIYEHQSFAIERNSLFSGNTTYFIPTDEVWLSGILNSKLIEYFYVKISNSVRGGYLRAFSQYIKDIPIVEASNQVRMLVTRLVEYICCLKEVFNRDKDFDLINSAQDKLMLEYFEQLINAIVYELYLPEDLHPHGCVFAQLLQTEALPNLDDIPGNELEAIRAICDRLSAPDHPIQQNLLTLDTLPVIRLIEGKG